MTENPFSVIRVIGNDSFKSMSDAEKLLFSGFQGLANRWEKAVYCVANNFNDLTFYPLAAQQWLDDIDIRQLPVDDPWDLLSGDVGIDGYVLCDMAADSDSANIATSVAGILGALPVDVSLCDRVEKAGCKQVEDVRGWSFDTLYDRYGARLSQSFAVELSPVKCLWGPRDFAVANQGVVFYGEEQRATVLGRLAASAPIYGWGSVNGESEEQFILQTGGSGDYYVAADAAFNLSVFARLDVKPQPVPDRCAAPVSVASVAAGADKAVVSVAFMMSDGDNLQWLLNRGDCGNWWGNPLRGTLPMGWTFSPSLYSLAPTVWNHYMATATEMDEIICGASGIGYVFDNIADNPNFPKFLEKTEAFLTASQTSLVATFGNSYPNAKYLRGFTQSNAVKGVIYTSFTPWVIPQGGKPVRYDGKAVIPTMINLRDNADAVIRQILGTPPNPPLYLIYVDAWQQNAVQNRPFDQVAKVYDALKTQRKVRIVKPSQLFSLVPG